MTDMRLWMAIAEDLSLGSALSTENIPDEYRDLPVIGQGATSIVLDAGEKVVVLTRDNIKPKWLETLGIGRVLRSFTTRRGDLMFKRFPVFVIEMDKLHPLSAENLKTVEALCDEFKQVRDRHSWKGQETPAERKAILTHFTAQERHALKPCMLFLRSLRGQVYDFDFSPENFMQNAAGEIVPFDPVIPSALQQKLLDAFELKARIEHRNR